jgi:hypothetical protein
MQVAMVLGWAAVGSALALTMRSTILRHIAGKERAMRSPPLGALEAVTATLFAVFAYLFGPSVEAIVYSTLGASELRCRRPTW